MRDPHDTIIDYLQTEKGTEQSGLNKYFFKVDANANKLEVKRAVEILFKVHVTKVNTLWMPGRPKRVRQVLGKTSDWKKAIVTLKTGEKIEVV